MCWGGAGWRVWGRAGFGGVARRQAHARSPAAPSPLPLTYPTPPPSQALVGGKGGEFQAPGSRVKALVLPTDEELSIAQQTLAVVGAQQQQQQPAGGGVGQAAPSA